MGRRWFVVLLFVLASCGGDGGGSASPTTQLPDPTSTAPGTPEPFEAWQLAMRDACTRANTARDIEQIAKPTTLAEFVTLYDEMAALVTRYSASAGMVDETEARHDQVEAVNYSTQKVLEHAHALEDAVNAGDTVAADEAVREFQDQAAILDAQLQAVGLPECTNSV